MVDRDVIGFVGLGTMGAPMAAAVQRAGFDLVVTDLARDHASELVDAGARWGATPAEVAAGCGVVFTSLPGPTEIDAVVNGPEGLLAGPQPGLVHVDLSTSSLDAVRRIADVERSAGVDHVDAPVSGGRPRALDGTLTVMASGPTVAFERARPALDAIGNPVFHLGDEAGAGTLVKLANNAVFLCAGLIAQEALVMVAKAGLDLERVLEVLESGSASMYLGMARPTLTRRFGNSIFRLGLAEKDVALALDTAAALEVDMPVTAAAHSVYERAVADGRGDEVFYATLQVLEAAAGIELPALPMDGSR